MDFHFGLYDCQMTSLISFSDTDFIRTINDWNPDSDFAFFATDSIVSILQSEYFQVDNYHHGRSLANCIISKVMDTVKETQSCNFYLNVSLHVSSCYYSKKKLLFQANEYKVFKETLSEANKVVLHSYKEEWRTRESLN